MGVNAEVNPADDFSVGNKRGTSPGSRTLVISFPRSGLNWLRHCTEHFGGRRTPGRTQIIAEGPTIFDRVHDVMRPNKSRAFVSLYTPADQEIYQKVALLLRDPRACFVSHYLGRRGSSFRKGLAEFEVFATNIVEFDRLREAEKAVFYFEDFVNQEQGTFAFLRFLGVEPTAQPDNFETLIESSRAWYRNKHGLINDGLRPTLNAAQQAAIWKMLERRLGAKFQQYVGRYYEASLHGIS